MTAVFEAVTAHINNVRRVVDHVYLGDHDRFVVGFYTDPEGARTDAVYIQHQYERPDAFTHRMETGYGRKWHVSPHATDSEIVLTCLKAAITNAEHEVREGFKYKGRAIFQPHVDVEALYDACVASDARPMPTQESKRQEVLG